MNMKIMRNIIYFIFMYVEDKLTKNTLNMTFIPFFHIKLLANMKIMKDVTHDLPVPFTFR